MKKQRWTTLIGKTFYQLTVQKLCETEEKGVRLWKCKCSCGNTTIVSTAKLNSGNTKSCGCLRQPSLIGKTFNKLTVIRDASSRRAGSSWLCKCECGGEKIVTTGQLRDNSVRSCGCLRSGNLKGGVRSLPKGYAVRNLIITTYKNNAHVHNRSFELTIKQCEVLFKSNCYYCNSSPSRIRKNSRTQDTYTYNGIDRLDNMTGYILRNVVSCCTKCNLKKGSDSKEEFLDWISQVAKTHNFKNHE